MRRAFSLAAITLVLHFSCFIRLNDAAASACAQAAAAASLEERGIVALDQALRDLTNPYTIMFVVARPEDVDYGTLAYHRKKLGARAIIVSATRGESRIEQAGTAGEEPAAEATRRALDAARAAGADLHFLNLRDLGHSKFASEALSIWGHEEALRRMVKAIRLHHPDVVATPHKAESGEGQHQAVARLALESFDAAADAKRLPEANSVAWQARRLFQQSDGASGEVSIDLNEFNHARGLTYGEIGLAAARMLSLSRQAGAATSYAAETNKRYYKLARSSEGEKLIGATSLLDRFSLAENLARSIAPPRVGDLAALDAITMREPLIESLREKLLEKRAEGSVEDMRGRYGAEYFRVVRFIEELEKAIALALGITFEAAPLDRVLVAGQKLTARLALRNGSNRSIPAAFHMPESLSLSGESSPYKATDVITVYPGAVAVREIQYDLPKEAKATLPRSGGLYEEEFYPVASSLPASLPLAPFGKRLVVIAEIGLGQTAIAIPAVIRFDIAPEVELSITPAFAVVSDWERPREMEFTARLRNRTPSPLAGALWVVPLALADDNYEPVPVSFAREDEEAVVKLKLKLPILKPPLSPDILVEFRSDRQAPRAALGFATIAVRSAGFELAEGIKVGYVRGADAWLPLALTALGVEHSEIDLSLDGTSASIAPAAPGAMSARCGGLDRFNTIIIDSDAYSARPALWSFNKCLLDYAERGGNLVVLSQQLDDWVQMVAFSRLAPFPIKLSTRSIESEVAPVQMIGQNHPLLNKPNLITERDFQGWVERRAEALPAEWASEYTPLLESADPGEEPNRGGMLVARYGEGTYLYLSYALRPQLLAMNAGAYRLLANIVSLPKTIKEQT